MKFLTLNTIIICSHHTKY